MPPGVLRAPFISTAHSFIHLRALISKSKALLQTRNRRIYSSASKVAEFGTRARPRPSEGALVHQFALKRHGKLNDLRRGAVCLVDGKKSHPRMHPREIRSHPRRTTRAFIPRSHHRSGVAAARITRGEARRARRMDPQEGPWSAAAAERYCALPLLCGDFVGCSLSLLASLSLPCSVAARALRSLSLQPSRLISRYLFTPTFYCHWIPTGQKAACRLCCIDNKVIKTICLIHVGASRIRNLGAGGPHADFHLRCVYREAIIPPL